MGAVAKWTKKACQQDGQDSRQKDAVEGSGAANRGDRRAEILYLVQVEQIGADQRAEASTDIGQRGGICPL